jgi:pSer/pThr/pTyr-binding forkhead associated (FHA) protein
VLDHVTLSRLHAHIELAGDGRVSIQDAGSSNGTYVNRNDCWVRAKRVTLSIGDRIRFGDIEVPLQTLTALFGKHAGIHLEARRFPIRQARAVARQVTGLHDHGPPLNKPRRNPATGKIEEDRPLKP